MLQILEATIGGTKRHLLDLCTGLDPAQFDVLVACPRVRSEARGDVSFVDDLTRAGIAVRIVPMVRAISPARDVAAAVRLAALVARGGFDVIHAHSSKAGFLGRQAALLSPRSKVVYSPHGFYFQNFSSPLRRGLFKALEKAAAFRTDALIALSRGEYDAAVKGGLVPRGRAKLVRNGIEHAECLPRAEARRRLGIDPTAVVVGTISRFTPQKAPLDLVDAVEELARERPDLVFAWFGDGELRARVEARIQSRGLAASFRIFGYRPDARELLPALDLFVLASRWEGLPYTILEAMDAGVPAIATDVVGSQDVIEDGRNGRLVPFGRPDLLARAAGDLLKNPIRLAELSLIAREDVLRRYSRASMVKEIASLYVDLAMGVRVG